MSRGRVREVQVRGGGFGRGLKKRHAMPNGRHGARAVPSKPLASHRGLGPCLPPNPRACTCVPEAPPEEVPRDRVGVQGLCVVRHRRHVPDTESGATMGKEDAQHGFTHCFCGWLGSGPEPWSGGNRTKERVSERGAELSTGPAVFENKARRRTLCTHPCTWPSSPHRSRMGRRRASPGRWATSQGQQAWCPWPQTSSRTWPGSSRDQARSAARTTWGAGRLWDRGDASTGLTLWTGRGGAGQRARAAAHLVEAVRNGEE